MSKWIHSWFTKRKKLTKDSLLEDTVKIKGNKSTRIGKQENKLMCDQEEYEVVERVILPEKVRCPDCGGLTLEGLEFCDKCGGEMNIQD